MSVTTIQSSTAAVSDKCDGSFTENGTKVTSQHGKIFYIDSGQGQNVDASYVSYAVTNTSGETRKNIWVRLESFTGGVVQLANPADANTPIGDIANSSTGVAFTLLKAPTSSTKAQSHVVKVYSGNPNLSGATLRYTCTFTFNKVMETIKARANKVTSITNTSASVVGSTFTITVQGDTGTMGAGNSIDGRSIWISPASRSSWPTESVRLESTEFTLYDNPSRGDNQRVSGYPKSNTLYFSIAAQDKYYYTAVYTFRIIGLAGSAVAVKPVGQISSGTQMKHNDVSDTAISNTINLSTASVRMAITKSMSTTATYNAGTQKLTFGYTISLTNSGSSDQTVDIVTDTPATSLAYVASSAQFNSASIPDPSTALSNSANLVFSGPFTVPANTTRTLTYSMIQRDACSSGSYSYTNSATASLGQLIIGSGASTFSQVVGSGTCANTTTTVTVTNPSLAPSAITNAPGSISTTGATFNATVDPNMQSGWTITFEWGTTVALSSTAITLADTTTATSVAYSVSSAQTGLSSGTTYYYRIKLSKTGSTTVYGEIVTFITAEVAANPTATTNNITNVSGTTNVSVTFNGTIDPNQVANGVKVRFEYAPRVSSLSTACTDNIGTVNYAPSSSTFVQIEDTSNTVDLVLSGSFPTAVEYLNSSSSNVVVLNTGSSGGGFGTTAFCFRIVGLYNSASANWSTSVFGDWVPFLATTKSLQSINYSQPANLIVGATNSTATATATSGLSVTYESSDTSICTVNSSTGLITAVAEGVCTLTATQAGNDSYYEATPVSVTFNITATTPTATTAAASSITGTSATINGTINGGGASTTTTFCYGIALDLSGCTSVTATESPITGSSNTSVSYGLTGLSTGTTYYFRVSGTNSQGSATGSILNFTTTVPTAQAIDFSYSTSKTYGDSPFSITATSKTPNTSGTATGLLVTFSSQTSSVCSVGSSSISSNISSVTVTILAQGTCTIRTVQSGGASGGTTYAAASNVDQSFTVNPKPLTITAENKNKNFGDTTPTFTATSGTLVGSDALSSTYTYNFHNGSYSSSTTAPSNVGTYTITPSAATFTSGSASNYTITYATGTYTIATKAITVTAANKSKTLGDSDPEFTYSYSSSFVGSDAVGSVTKEFAGTGGTTYSSNSTPPTNTGTYSITPTGITLSSGTLTNYSFTYVAGTYTIYAVATPTVSTTSLPNGTVSTAYSQTLAATGGSGTYTTWSITSGTLPAGLTLNTSTGVISGTPTTAGTSNITVTVTDSGSQTSSGQALTITIESATTYTITINTSSNGTGSSSAATVLSGGSVNLSATASSGFTFTSWSCTVGSLANASSSSTSLSGITNNTTCTMTFTSTSSSSGGRNTSPTQTQNSSSKKIVVSRVSNELNAQVSNNQRPVFVGTNSTFTPGNSTNSTQSVANSAAATTTNAGGIVAVVTNSTQSPSSSSNSAVVSAANTTAQTEVSRNSNVPAAVSVNRDENTGKVAVTATNGWTGRLSVAVVDTSSGEEVESFVEIVIAPTPVAAPQINFNPPTNPFTPPAPTGPTTPNRSTINTGLTINWQPSNSEVTGYVVTVNEKVACTSTTSSCTINQIIGPKSKVEVFAQGNDNTFSPPVVVPEFKPAAPIPGLVVYFPLASSRLTRAEVKKLDEFVAAMKVAGLNRVELQGHTDIQGTAKGYDNQTLSKNRANVVANYLRKNLKVITRKDQFADTKPAVLGTGEPVFQNNRRTEVLVW